jgi:protein-tyrosine phosphatase
MRRAIIRVVIDLHAHILPGLDDGPPTLDASAEMAAAAVAAGTRVIAATSHVNRSFGLLPEDLRRAREQVAERLRADGIALEVVQGGEVAVSRIEGLGEADLRALTLGGGPWLLLECALSSAAPSMEPVVATLRRRGLEVLLAHPERSPSLMRSPRSLERLIDLGALGQVTSTALSGRFGDTVRKVAFEMLERGHVHVIASDGHSADGRPPDLLCALEALERRYEDPRELFEWMTVDVPGAILAGERPPPRPPTPRRRGLLRRLRAERRPTA